MILISQSIKTSPIYLLYGQKLVFNLRMTYHINHKNPSRESHANTDLIECTFESTASVLKNSLMQNLSLDVDFV